MKYHCYIGRWQSPHKGHRWLIDQHLNKNEQVLILIRDVERDEKNFFTAQQVQMMLMDSFADEIGKGLVKLQIIPDIASVNYGRGVGYDVVEHKPPENIKRISATEIRAKIKAGDDSWKEMVMPGVIEWLEDFFKNQA